MSRPYNQPQHQSQQTIMKLQMLQSSVTRVISQNKKLQILLDQSQQFVKLRQYTSQVTANLHRLNVLFQSIRNLDLQVKTSRQDVQTTLNVHCDHINKHVVAQMQALKTKIKTYQNKLEDLKVQQKIKVRKSFQKTKLRLEGQIDIQFTQTKSIVQDLSKKFNDQIRADIVPKIQTHLERQLQIQKTSSRTQIGHLYNLLSFYKEKQDNFSWNSHQNSVQIKGPISNQSYQINPSTIVSISIEKIKQRISDISLKSKGVQGEINWLQIKKKKQRVNTKYSQKSQTTHQQIVQNPHLIEMTYQLQDIHFELLGLSRFCDKMSFQKQLKTPSSSSVQLFSMVSIQTQRQMMQLFEKVTQIKSQISDYRDFYKNFSL